MRRHAGLVALILALLAPAPVAAQNRAVLEVDADHPRVLLDLAVLNSQEGEPAEATRLLERVLSDRQATPETERAAKDLLAGRR